MREQTRHHIFVSLADVIGDSCTQGIHTVHLYSTLSTDCYVIMHTTTYDYQYKYQVLVVDICRYQTTILSMYSVCIMHSNTSTVCLLYWEKTSTVTFLTHGLSLLTTWEHTVLTSYEYRQFESRSQRLPVDTHFLELRHKETCVTLYSHMSFFRSTNHDDNCHDDDCHFCDCPSR